MIVESSLRRRPVRLALALVAGSLAAAAHAATTIQIPLQSHFNADVVLNGAAGDFDTTMDSIEGIWSFATATAAAGGSCDGPWLPDEALFAANSQHPTVRLAVSNDEDGLNAWQTAHAAGSIEVDVLDLHYSELHLFATGAWETFLTVTLDYTTGEPDVFVDIAYPSWFDPTPVGFYELVHGLDRARLEGDTFVCEDVDNPGILGRKLVVDPTRQLASVTLTRTDNDEGVLSVFGLTGVLAEEAVDFDLTSQFNADVVANVTPVPSCLLENYDWEYDTIEPQKHLATQSLISCNNAGFGLPDDGVFPATHDGPAFDLAYSNADDGVNARRSVDAADSFGIDVPDQAYDEIHLFGSSGGGATSFDVELQYATGSPQTVPVELPDWSDGGPFANPDTYVLFGPLHPQGSDGPFWISWNAWVYLHAIRIPVDRARVLETLTVDRPEPGGGDPATTLAILGAAGVVRADPFLFADGFEWNDTDAWSTSVTP